MSYLIDTNVISETIKPRPTPAVLNWFDSVPSSSLYISVLTLGEIRRGIERLCPGTKKENLISWFEHTLVDWFEDRVLPVGPAVADRWGYCTGRSKLELSAIDSLLAATALSHNLKLVTRNVSDFKVPELEVINPWNF